ncbi:hypothetical protein ACG2F4_07195 [Halalkalibaculum sp. DA3122]|uniref:hypothetical protein n=1 Tax=Halalkalibaculum sp. DA3122 TaxID=3373607 RepID=UPI0037548610
MSAIAFTTTREKTVLLSDGMALKGNGKIHSMKMKKAFKINQQTGILWGGSSGSLINAVKREVKRKGYKTVYEVSEAVTTVFKAASGIDGVTDIWERSQYLVYVIGYDETDRIKILSFNSCNESRLKPKDQGYIDFGKSGCLAVDRSFDKTSYPRLLSEKYWPLYQDLEYATQKAFEEMVNNYNEQGMDVGGKIFMEVIRPPEINM